MDISTYLRRTISSVHDANLATEQPLFAWMVDSLSELALTSPMQALAVSTSDVSHRYVRLSRDHHIVWDVALNQTLWSLLVGMQYERLATGIGDAPDSRAFRATASAVFRRTIFSYVSQKLARFPRTAAAFAALAEELPLTHSLEVPESDLIAELFTLQRLLMFYHEATHAVLAERDDLRSQSKVSLTRLLERLGTMISEDPLAGDFATEFPEFSDLTRDQRFTHFAEELNCDLQAFVFASMAAANAPGIPRRAWQDTIGMLFGAARLLATTERVLKLSASKWTEFAGESSDGAELTSRSIVMEQHLKDRPLFHVRRWNMLIAIGAVLERLGKARQEDALAWQEYVVTKTQGLVETMETYLVRELNVLATARFIAKVAARARAS